MKAWTIIILAAIVLSACTTQPSVPSSPPEQVCPQDAKICPDGSAVGRTGPGCTFVCPPAQDDEFCDYGSPKRDYKGKSLDVCSRIKFACPDGEEYFSDQCGCGCTVQYAPPSLENSKVTNT